VPALQDRPEESLEAMAMRQGPKVPLLVYDLRGHRHDGSRINVDERLAGRHESFDDLLVFLRFARARRVDQAAARRDAGRGVRQHLALGQRERTEILLATPPADVRVATERAEAGARRIEQNATEGGGKWQRLQGVGLDNPDGP
jgi:hypothetical protein